jgi:hypothetical protein
MGLKLYGIGVAQCPDNVGETILLDGLDISKLRTIRDEHGDDSAFRQIGVVSKAKKIHAEHECEDDRQKRCWAATKVPFLYIEGELADDEQHPNAESASALIRFASRPDIPLELGFSIDGGIIERRTRDGQVTEDKETGKILARTLGTSVAFTTKPCNPKCFLRMQNDLTKSDMTMKAPSRYFQALANSQKSSSFNELTMTSLHIKVEKLKKSLGDYFGAFTDMKCEKCHTGVRFFKSASSLPNVCQKCGHHFSVSSLWKALNR